MGEKILQQDKHQKWFFIVVGTVFSGLVAYLFLKYQTIPNQLEAMWFGACTYIAAAYSKAINQAEKLSGKDLDGDGDIGVENAGASTQAAAEATQPILTEPQVVAELVAQQVQAIVTETLGPTATEPDRFGPP